MQLNESVKRELKTALDVEVSTLKDSLALPQSELDTAMLRGRIQALEEFKNKIDAS